KYLVVAQIAPQPIRNPSSLGSVLAAIADENPRLGLLQGRNTLHDCVDLLCDRLRGRPCSMRVNLLCDRLAGRSCSRRWLPGFLTASCIVAQQRHDRPNNRDNHAVEVEAGNTEPPCELRKQKPTHNGADHPKQDVKPYGFGPPIDSYASD